MQDKWVSGTFDDYNHANEVLQALTKRFDASEVSVFAEDPSALRSLAIPTERAGFDSVILTFGLVGALVGLIGGLLSAPTYGGTVIVTPVLASFMGAAAGWCLGLVFGAVVHFDIPTYNAVTEAQLKKGKVLIVVHSRNHDERYLAESIMDEFDVGDVIASNENLIGV